MKVISILLAVIISAIAFLLPTQVADAFCGFYVAKADASLYNQASQIILARDGDRTVLTMANDYQGEVKDFALVVPVPVVLKKEQVNIGNPKIIERLDSFSSPRLVEYFDPNPCAIGYLQESATDSALRSRGVFPAAAPSSNAALGVRVEEQFAVGEYDILILSAKESNGLETWLNQNGYKIPRGASQVLQPYIRQNFKFFVAKVNLQQFNKDGFQKLRPLQMAFESSKLMLPIRLGMLNAQGDQDLIVYLLSPKGQIELTNYRSVKVPSDVEIPEFVQSEFMDFYKAMFQKSYEQEGKKTAFLEYAWDMGSCDPCSAQPLSPDELRQAGVFWLNSPRPGLFPTPQSSVFISRLHVRYARDRFPQDLQFQETSNRQFFQGRYVIRHPFRSSEDCDAARNYRQTLRQRQEREAQTLAQLTGWDLQEINRKINFTPETSVPWWRRLWP